ncbi:MAG TPA: MYXO-CTERM sorting domain-containing protein [Polyangiaceae bacterium]|jgi:MYXO-CTERM domain-containing protein|nr:MYXO-CTERM sorting domain-containing protein [Polyangiaceae bacterium]
MPIVRSFSQRLLAALTILGAFFAVVLASGSAHADRVSWKKTTIKESNSSWYIEVDFYMSRPPDVAHVPMQFKFQPDVYYERSLVDGGGDKPQERKVPLDNKAPLIESVDVGFLDPGSGKTQARTRFSFKITRDRDFFAGEYRVTITDKSSGRKVGGEQRLILEGDNEVIDRRSMVFDTKKADEQAKAKREAKAKAADEEAADEAKNDPSKDDYWAGGPTEPEKPDQPLPPPAHMQDHPGACGCRTVGAPASGYGAAWLALSLGAIVALRRRRSV